MTKPVDPKFLDKTTDLIREMASKPPKTKFPTLEETEDALGVIEDELGPLVASNLREALRIMEDEGGYFMGTAWEFIVRLSCFPGYKL